MNGAETLSAPPKKAGIDVCFSNPGTSEMPLVAAFDSEPGLRGVLVLFEGVASGAADGYGRMAEKPAMDALPSRSRPRQRGRQPAQREARPQPRGQPDRRSRHLAPSLQPAARLRHQVAGEAGVGLVPRVGSAASLGKDVRKAIATAWSKPGRIATLTVPTDCQWGDAGTPKFGKLRVPDPPAVANDTVESVARSLRGDGKSMLLIGAYGARRRGLVAAGRIAAATGCRLGLETFPTRLERGPDLPILERVPSFPSRAATSSAACAASCSRARSIRSRSSAIRRESADSFPTASRSSRWPLPPTTSSARSTI